MGVIGTCTGVLRYGVLGRTERCEVGIEGGSRQDETPSCYEGRPLSEQPTLGIYESLPLPRLAVRMNGRLLAVVELMC